MAYPCVQAQAVELLCRCDDIPDDGIELRVLKGLLTAVTSNAVHVHGQALLLVRHALLLLSDLSTKWHAPALYFKGRSQTYIFMPQV